MARLGRAQPFAHLPRARLGTAFALLTGSATAGIAASDVVAGGKTVIITLAGDTWLPAGGSFDGQRQNIINGLVSAQAEAHGWNVEVQAKQGVAGVVRTSDAVVTITLDAQAAYVITAQETITVTVPGSAVLLGGALVATPTFTVSTAAAAGNPWSYYAQMRRVA